MIRNCSKAQALINAQAVMALAVTFGHGDVVTLSVNASAVVLTLIYDSAWYVEEREKEWLSERVLCGIKWNFLNDTEVGVYQIQVFWEFNPSLP